MTESLIWLILSLRCLYGVKALWTELDTVCYDWCVEAYVVMQYLRVANQRASLFYDAAIRLYLSGSFFPCFYHIWDLTFNLYVLHRLCGGPPLPQT